MAEAEKIPGIIPFHSTSINLKRGGDFILPYFIAIPTALLWRWKAKIRLWNDSSNLFPFICGGASHAPPACSGVRRRRL